MNCEHLIFGSNYVYNKKKQMLSNSFQQYKTFDKMNFCYILKKRRICMYAWLCGVCMYMKSMHFITDWSKRIFGLPACFGKISLAMKLKWKTGWDVLAAHLKAHFATQCFEMCLCQKCHVLCTRTFALMLKANVKSIPVKRRTN